MKDRDPPPLTDPSAGAPALVRDAIAGARARMPSPDDLARVAARLPLGPPPAGPHGGAPHASPVSAVPAPAASTPSVLSSALIGAALGAVVAGASFLWDARRPPPPPAAPLPEATAVDTKARPIEVPPTSPAPVHLPAAAAPARETAAPRPVQAPALAPSGAAPTGPEPDPAPVAAREGAGAPAPVEDAETEVHLLGRAQEAIRTSPAEALALAERHAARFPGGALAQEREVVAVEALIRLGRRGEAQARVARFVQAFPGSLHRSRLEALVAP
jgi:hypothetical protein